MYAKITPYLKARWCTATKVGYKILKKTLLVTVCVLSSVVPYEAGNTVFNVTQGKRAC